jgi:hypothetical protein
MKTTHNLIMGEVFAVEKQLFLPFIKMYSKQFYEKSFIKKVGRTLMYKHPQYKVTAAETDEDFILRIKYKEDAV